MMILIFAIAASLTSITAVQAGKVPIPCTGDKILWVADLPGVHDVAGKAINLGYKMSWCGWSGEWIGHVGSDRSYYPMKPGAVESLVSDGTLSAMPRPPGFWSSAVSVPSQFIAEWLWIAVLVCLGVAIPFSNRSEKSQHEPVGTPTRDGVLPAAPAAAQTHDVVARRPAAAQANSLAGARMARALRPATAASPAFGKR